MAKFTVWREALTAFTASGYMLCQWETLLAPQANAVYFLGDTAQHATMTYEGGVALTKHFESTGPACAGSDAPTTTASPTTAAPTTDSPTSYDVCHPLSEVPWYHHHNWHSGGWSTCDVECGQGYQHRSHICCRLFRHLSRDWCMAWLSRWPTRRTCWRPECDTSAPTTEAFRRLGEVPTAAPTTP